MPNIVMSTGHVEEEHRASNSVAGTDAQSQDATSNTIFTPLERFFADIGLGADNGAECDDEIAKQEVAGENVVYDVEPRVWGRHFWATLHLIAYAYPEQPNAMTRQAALQLFDALRVLLPCANCRDNYRANWRSIDIGEHLGSRASLIEWMILLDNSVRAETGQPPLDYATYINRLTESDAVVSGAASDDYENGDDDKDDDEDDDDNKEGQNSDENDEKSRAEPSQPKNQHQRERRQQASDPQQRLSAQSSRYRSLSIPPSMYGDERALKRFVTRNSAERQQEMNRNPTAFAAAALHYDDGSNVPLDPRRLRGAQRDSFAQASRYRQADIVARREALRAAERRRDEQRLNEPSTSRFKKSPGKKSAKVAAGLAASSSLLSLSTGSLPARANASNQGSNHRFRREQEQRRAVHSNRSALQRRGLEVKPPRPCPNCNRKNLVPSIF